MNNNDLIPIPLLDGHTFQCDNSFLSTIQGCHRGAAFYNSFKREKLRSTTALQFGTAIHKVLETRYGGMGDDVDPSEQYGHNNEPTYFPKQVAQLEKIFDGLDTGEDHRNFNYAVELIQAYNKTYPFEEFEVLGIEIPFMKPLITIPLGGECDILWFDPEDTARPRKYHTSKLKEINIVWTGRIDLIIRRPDGRVYIWDHKTASMLGASYFNEYELSAAMLGYAQIAEELLQEKHPDLKVHGYNMNVLCTRKITRTGKGIEFQRKLFNIDRWKYSEWQNDVTFLLRRYFENLLSGYMPKSPNNCAGKYGMCQFHDVCTLPESQRGGMLYSGLYKDVTWDPTK